LTESELLQIRNISERLLPQGYELLPATNQIYELELAMGELNTLKPEELIRRGAYFYKVQGKETYHYQLCTGAPLLLDKRTSMRLRTFFQAYQFKTGYVTHGLFPYRGKFHPQMIKAVMNIIGLKEGDTVLDPMTGCGTTNIEASIMGINSVGVELSPFCCLMSDAKVRALELDPEELREDAKDPDAVFDRYDKKKEHVLLVKRREDTRLSEPIELLFRLAYLDSVGFANRRANKKPRELFPLVLEKYVSAITNFLQIKEKLGLKMGKATIVQGDCRDLAGLKTEIADESIDGIVTSPPYSFAIDYLKGDQMQLEYMGYNLDELRKSMIGLRGRGMPQKVLNYMKDMDRAIGEMARVLKKNKYCVIAIGSNVIQLEHMLQAAIKENNHEILREFEKSTRLEDSLARIGERHGLVLERRLSRPIEGIRNVMRSEELLFLKKT
jgi:DNA modification methylase